MIKPAQVKLRSKQDLFEKIHERVNKLSAQKTVGNEGSEVKVLFTNKRV